MFSTEKTLSVLVRIEQDSHSFFTKVYSEGRTLRSERFNTKAAALMALEFFRKEYKLDS